MGNLLRREAIFNTAHPLLHWGVGETLRLCMRSLCINIRTVIFSIQNWRLHQPFLCATALSFGSCATLCNPERAWAVIPYGWTPVSSHEWLWCCCQGSPRRAAGRESDKAGGKGPLPLSQRGDEPQRELSMMSKVCSHHLIRKGRESKFTKPSNSHWDPLNPSASKVLWIPLCCVCRDGYVNEIML